MGAIEVMKPSSDRSSDSEDRIQDFLSRHGGAGASPAREETIPPREETIDSVRGWSEVYAADGYKLRCDWSRVGSREEMTFSEVPPGKTTQDN
jgi:hypothetical protein